MKCSYNLCNREVGLGVQQTFTGIYCSYKCQQMNEGRNKDMSKGKCTVCIRELEYLRIYHGAYRTYCSQVCMESNRGGKVSNNNINDREQRFTHAGGIIPGVTPIPMKTDASPSHFSKILTNPHKNIWISGDGREIEISEMADQHLINTMRYLMRNFEAIKKCVIDGLDNDLQRVTSRVTKQQIVRFKNIINNTGSNVNFYYNILPCFQTLAEEIQTRFGNRALRSLYDGN